MTMAWACTADGASVHPAISATVASGSRIDVPAILAFKKLSSDRESVNRKTT
jgi:hypothetical protein